MTLGTKRIVLLFLSITLLSIILLSSSLSNLHLHDGRPFPSAGDSESVTAPAMALPSVSTYSNIFLRGLLALIFLILATDVFIRLMALVDIKQILRLVLIILLLLALAVALPRITPGKPALSSEESSNLTILPSSAYPTSPLGKPPQELIWLILFIFIMGVSLPAIKMLKRHLRSRRVKEQLLQEVEYAVNAMKSGEDFTNVIMRCYLQMTCTLQEERGIKRNYNMTVREFEDLLESKGFPPVPVNQLSCLFEKARYGKKQTIIDDEKMAVESLNEIIQFCRSEGAKANG